MVDAENGSAGGANDPITSWVGAARSGDREAAECLYRAAYDELRRIAHAQRRRLRPSETFSTTAVVSELYLRLARGPSQPVVDRHHFFSLAARVIRQILIDGARRDLAARRGGGGPTVSVAGLDFVAPARPQELLALDEALDRLAAQDRELAEVVELHFFAGLSFEEMAESSARSERSLRRDWRRARAFLYDCLRNEK